MKFDAWGEFIVRRRRAVLLAVGLVFLVSAVFVPRFHTSLEGVGYESSGSESARALALVKQSGGPAEFAAIVAQGDAGPDALRAAVGRAGVVAKEAGTVTGIGPTQVAADGKAAFAPLLMDGSTGDRQDDSKELQKTIDTGQPAGVEVDLTGISPLFGDLIHQEEVGLLKADVVGVPLAFAVLLLVMGSLVAAALPIVIAMAGLIVTFGVLGLLSYASTFNVFVENIAALIGLGVGIDYAMLIVRRYREERDRGLSDEEAIVRTMATAGRTVAFSGAAVAVCLLPLSFTGLPFFGETAIGAIAVLIFVVLAAITLLPALLLTLGPRIDKGRLRWQSQKVQTGRWAAWARGVMRRPWPIMVAALAILVAAASPTFGLEEGNDLNARALQEEPSGRALVGLQEHFPDLAASAVQVVTRAPDGAAAVVGADKRFVGLQRLPLQDGVTLLLTSPPGGSDSGAATRAVEDLRLSLARAEVPALVGGYSAESLDFTDSMHDGTPLVVALALGLCLFVLIGVFRSPVLALKAIVMNLLSLGAAFGLVVFVFQDGHGEGILAFTSPGYIQSWMPLTLFMIVFGLSMDYEVFMVSRMREEYDRCGDTTEAVARGLEKTGGVVTSAALIMVAIFGSSMLSTIPEMKQLGFGLAAAVLIDATLIRATLVPAFMRIAGRWNWWMPAWLDRRLPAVHHG
ncbi:MAG: putative drug exporter of the superfamily [Solirubrobacteraceae bacterium]|jgi:RND superfamily putative drug exporter|nr:putative drug exporter of the superfamily [Solirubrobacteraceae bacterium]